MFLSKRDRDWRRVSTGVLSFRGGSSGEGLSLGGLGHPGAHPASAHLGVGRPGKKLRWQMGQSSGAWKMMTRGADLWDLKTCDEGERKQVTARHDTGLSQGVGQCCLWTPHGPANSRPSALPRDPRGARYGRSVRGKKPVRCGGWGRGGCRGFLSRTEQGTEIQREGQGPRPHPREAAPGQARLGSRTGGTRPGAGGSQGWSGMNPRS